jgi:hypothetical protein
MKRLLLAFLAIACPVLAGPYDQAYAIIATDPKPSADPLLRPVIVNRVDGENSMNNQSVVAPGKRQVTVDLPPRKGFSLATQRTFELDARACTRYFIAAKLASQTTQDWKPVVRSEEAIGECAAKFLGAPRK